ncbi:MAG: metal transporter, partial [Burkholderiaceae bacterium]
MNAPRRSAPIGLLIVIILALLVAVAVLLYLQLNPGAGPLSLAPGLESQRVTVVNGLTVITLDVATQQRSGIQAQPMAAVSHQAEAAANGTVLDLQPLIDLRTNALAAQADAAATQAAASAARQDVERSGLLYRDNRNVSLMAYQAAQAQSAAEQAKMQAAAAKLQGFRGAARQQFGEAVGRWVLDPQSSQIA